MATAPTAVMPESPSASPSEGASARADSVQRPAAKKRMLIVVNPYATTVSDRLKNLVVYALQGRYEVEAVTTEAKDHATEIGRQARDGSFDVIVVFGGDGTLNEVANGLAGSDIPLSVLPGGSTNVVARTLGIPNEVVDATEHLLSLADDFRPRRIDLGRIGERRFIFSCGVGIDATVVRRVDAHPRLKAKAGPYYYTWAAISGFYRQYLRNPVRMRVTADGRESEGITVLCQNSDPFTYFSRQPVRVCRDVAIDDGTLSLAVLRRAAQRDAPTLVARMLSGRLTATDHRQISHFDDLTSARIESVSPAPDGSRRPFPIQVDGDYIGEQHAVELGIDPGALTVVS